MTPKIPSEIRPVPVFWTLQSAVRKCPQNDADPPFDSLILEQLLQSGLPNNLIWLNSCRLTKVKCPANIRDQLYQQDLFWGVLYDLQFGRKRPPNTFLYYRYKVRKAGYVYYPQGINSWAALLAKTRELLKASTDFRQIHRDFQLLLPRPLGGKGPADQLQFLDTLWQHTEQSHPPREASLARQIRLHYKEIRNNDVPNT